MTAVHPPRTGGPMHDDGAQPPAAPKRRKKSLARRLWLWIPVAFGAIVAIGLLAVYVALPDAGSASSASSRTGFAAAPTIAVQTPALQPQITPQANGPTAGTPPAPATAPSAQQSAAMIAALKDCDLRFGSKYAAIRQSTAAQETSTWVENTNHFLSYFPLGKDAQASFPEYIGNVGLANCVMTQPGNGLLTPMIDPSGYIQTTQLEAIGIGSGKPGDTVRWWTGSAVSVASDGTQTASPQHYTFRLELVTTPNGYGYPVVTVCPALGTYC